MFGFGKKKENNSNSNADRAAKQSKLVELKSKLHKEDENRRIIYKDPRDRAASEERSENYKKQIEKLEEELKN